MPPSRNAPPMQIFRKKHREEKCPATQKCPARAAVFSTTSSVQKGEKGDARKKCMRAPAREKKNFHVTQPRFMRVILEWRPLRDLPRFRVYGRQEKG